MHAGNGAPTAPGRIRKTDSSKCTVSCQGSLTGGVLSPFEFGQLVAQRADLGLEVRKCRLGTLGLDLAVTVRRTMMQPAQMTAGRNEGTKLLV